MLRNVFESSCKYLIIIMSRRTQQHLLKLQVNIKQVLIKSSLNRDITFQIKCDGKIVAKSKKTYQIENDHCLPYEKHSFEINAQYDPISKKYKAKIFNICLKYETLRGSLAGGFATFDLFQSSQSERQWILPIQTSVQDTKINFSTSYQLISKKEKERPKQISNDPYHLINSKKQTQAHKNSAINELTKTQGKNSKKNLQVNSKNLRQNQNDRTKKLDGYKSFHEKNIEKYKINPKIRQDYKMKIKDNDQMEKFRKKLEIQREEKVRSISKLKMEIDSKLPDKNIQDITENSHLKQKLRNLERKQKSYLINISQLNADLQKRKTKLNQLQKNKQQLQRALGQKQILYRSAQSTIRTLTQQMESLSCRQRIISRKGDARQGIFKDQMKRLQQKLQNQQLEIKLANQQKNDTLKRYADLQKINQTYLKEKDQKMNEQRIKLSKIIEQSAIKQRQYLNNIQNLNQSINSLQSIHKSNENRVHEVQLIIIKYQNDMAIIKEQLKDQRQKFELQFGKSSQSFEQQINVLKIKNNQLTNQRNQLKDKIKRLQIGRAQNQTRIKELQENMKAKIAEISKNILKINTFKRDIDSINQQNAKRLRQLDQAKSNNSTLNNKNIELKQKLQLEKTRRQEANNQLQKQINSNSKQRELLQNQIKDLKWAIVKLNDTISQLEYILKESNDINTKLNEQIINKSQRLDSLDDNNKMIQNECENINNEKRMYNSKIKELQEDNRIKGLQLQEQKKMRIKAEQRIQAQKQKLNQYLLINKQKMSQDESKLKEKEGILLKRQEESQSLQLQLTQKIEEIIALKNNNEGIFRQMQLSKMDNDNLKSEINSIESKINSLKKQYNQLKISKEAISNELQLVQQNLAIQKMKFQSLNQQFQEYKQNILMSFTSLCNQLFKQDPMQSNIITSSLRPFPTKQLSTLEIDLIQKRNSFIIRYKQKINQYQQENSTLESQIKQLNSLYSQRQQIEKKQSNEERQKLKALLYENMVEKTQISSLVAQEKAQKEQILRQMEKVKVEIIRKQEAEQQLNGQLHLLMLQYDGIKSQNQDLSDTVFKYKQQQIRARAEYQQRLMIQTEEHAQRIDKLKQQNNEKQKKLINSGKQLIQAEEKCKKLDEERLKIKEDYQLLGQSNKILEDKIFCLNLEITKLNNIIKNHEKQSANFKQNIERLQSQLIKNENKCQVLLGNISKTNDQLYQMHLQREILRGKLSNHQQKYSQLQKLLHQKGEVSKQKIEKKMEQSSQLKTKLIEKESQLELKQFYLKQKCNQIENLTHQNQQLKNDILTIKGKNKEANQLNEDINTKLRDYQKMLEQLQSDKDKRQQIINQNNFTIFSLQSQLEEVNRLELELKNKQRQILKLREKKTETDDQFLGEVRKYRQQIYKLKQQLSIERKNHQYKDNQYQKNINSLQTQNNQKYQYIQSEFQKQKEQFSKRVQDIERHNKRIMIELQQRAQRIMQQLNDYKQSERHLYEEGVKKDSIITILKKQVQHAQNQSQQFKQKYNKYYMMHQEIKKEMEMLTKQHQNKLKMALDQRASQAKQLYQKLSEIDRKIERLKHSQQMLIKNDAITRKDLKLTVDRIFNKIVEMLKELQLKNIGNDFEFSKAKSQYSFY